MGKMCHEHPKQKKAHIARLMLDKVNFKVRNIAKQKGMLHMIKRWAIKKIIQNLHEPNNIAFFIVYSITVVPISFLPFCLPLPSPPLSPTVNPLSIVHVHGSFPHVHLTNPFPFLPPLPPSLTAISLFRVSMSLVPFSSLVNFVH